MSLNAVAVDDVDATVDVTLDKAPTGGGTNVSLLTRKVGTSDYRLRVYLRSANLLQLVRMVNGVETVLSTVSLSVPGGGYAPGQVVHMRLRADGSGPTALTGKVWFGAATEPSAWMIQATDSTAQLQGLGGVGVFVYESSSATNAPVTVTSDNLRATTPGTEPPPPDPNVDPVAAFLAVPSDLTVDFDASGSDDPDGSITSYAWTFGDGASTTGPAPSTSHTYAAPDTYAVTLTVTDDRGGTHQVTHPVTVTEPPPPTGPVVVASDGFGRSVTGGWGSADVGGAWTLAGGAASSYSVSGGAGRMVATAGGSRAMSLNAVAVDDVDATVDVTLDKAPTGGGTNVSLLTRKVGTSDYRLRVYLRSANLLQLVRMVNGVETVLSTVSLSVPGGGYAPGQVVHMRLRADGSGPTALTGKVWFGAATEPSAWMIQATDSTAQLQGLGGVGVFVYESSSATNAPVTVTSDNLRATTPGP